MNYKISVIVPCYNVEKYIDRCVESIIHQTIGIENLQIIFVNDASPDSVGEHLSKYEQQYPDNICIINLEKNEGLSNARNIGMQYVMAEYIAFVDSDDWIELTMYETMYEKAIAGNYDIVICDNDRPVSEETAVGNRTGEDKVFVLNSIEARKSFIKDYRLNVMAWNKLYKMSLFLENDIAYPSGLLYEDNYTTMLLYLKAERIYVLKEVMYHWFVNNSSITYNNQKVLDRIEVQTLLFNRLKADGYYEEYKAEIDFNCYEKFLAETIFFLVMQNDKNVELIDLIKRSFLGLIPDIKNNKYYKGKEKISMEDIQYLSHFVIERDVNMELVESLKRKYLRYSTNSEICELLNIIWEIKGMVPYLASAEEAVYKEIADCSIPMFTFIKEELGLVATSDYAIFDSLISSFTNRSRNTTDILKQLIRAEDLISDGAIDAAVFGVGVYTDAAIAKYYPKYVVDHAASGNVGKRVGDFIVKDIESVIDRVNSIIIGDALYKTSLEAHIRTKYKEKNLKIINPFQFQGYYSAEDFIHNDYNQRAVFDSEEKFNQFNKNCYNIGPVNAYVNEVFEHVPLFREVEIETVNRCNGICDFCPVNKKHDSREYHLMSEELYKNIIDQFAEINYAGAIAPFSNNEPFLDNHIIERTKYMREKLPNARIHMYTNGTLLTLERFKEIVNYLDELIIDNYHHEQKLLKTSQAVKEYCDANPELKKKVTIVIRDPKEILTSRGGDAPNRKELKSFGECKCALPYQQLIIRPDGKVSLCCNDPLGKNTLGDLTKESILDVWYGEKYNQIRNSLQDGRKGWNHCEYCDTFYMY